MAWLRAPLVGDCQGACYASGLVMHGCVGDRATLCVGSQQFCGCCPTFVFAYFLPGAEIVRMDNVHNVPTPTDGGEKQGWDEYRAIAFSPDGATMAAAVVNPYTNYHAKYKVHLWSTQPGVRCYGRWGWAWGLAGQGQDVS